MGVTTSFFIATLDELKAKAPGWVVPEYGPYEVREGINPFTKQPMKIAACPMLTESPAEAPPDKLHELIPSERAFAWKMIGHEPGELMKILLGSSEEDVARLRNFALIGPDDQECWVSEIPTPFVEALAALSADRVPAIAAEWGAALEWDGPPTPVLEQLVEVATEAMAAKKQMYAYVSL